MGRQAGRQGGSIAVGSQWSVGLTPAMRFCFHSAKLQRDGERWLLASKSDLGINKRGLDSITRDAFEDGALQNGRFYIEAMR